MPVRRSRHAGISLQAGKPFRFWSVLAVASLIALLRLRELRLARAIRSDYGRDDECPSHTLAWSRVFQPDHWMIAAGRNRNVCWSDSFWLNWIRINMNNYVFLQHCLRTRS